MFKKIIKKFIPPVILDFKNALLKSSAKKPIRNNSILWQGNYSSWEEAEADSTGYDADVIFNRTAEAILKVKKGEAVYERDSVIFNKPEYSWPLLAILLRIAAEKNNRLNLLDFGGSLGSSYFQNRSFINTTSTLLWSVVEQHHYIDYGNTKIADENLKFYFTIEECISERQPTVLLLSGVIQCISNPYTWLEKFIEKKFEYIIFDRTAFIDSDKDKLTVQHVPESIYKASYPAWFFNKSNILNVMADKYDFIIDFNNGFTPDIQIDGKRAYWNGLFFKRKANE